jgi:hypothetical protein
MPAPVCRPSPSLKPAIRSESADVLTTGMNSAGRDVAPTMTYRREPDISGASHWTDDLLSRDGASANFSDLNAWFTLIKLSGASQTASRPLFTSQQFHLGGAAFGRGYGAAEIGGGLPDRSSSASTTQSTCVTGPATGSTALERRAVTGVRRRRNKPVPVERFANCAVTVPHNAEHSVPLQALSAIRQTAPLAGLLFAGRARNKLA